MTYEELNRLQTSPEKCGSVLVGILPDPCVRIICLKVLRAGIVQAHSISPAGWSITLFDDGLRLNIGRTEAFTLFSKEVRVFLLVGDGGEPAPAASFFTPSPWDTPTDTQVFTALLPSEASQIAPYYVWLCKNFEKFAAEASLTKSGKPCRTPYSRFHSAGVISYLNTALNEEVPNPVY